MTAENRRPPITLAVVASRDWRAAKSFCAALSSSLLPGDNIVILSGDRSPSSPTAWREVRRAGRLGIVQNLPTLRDIVIVIDDRVQHSEGLLTVLAIACSTEGVGAVAPRTNVANGDELYVGIPYGMDAAARRLFLRSAASRSQALTPATHLDGPCVALRRFALEAAGGVKALHTRGGLTSAFDALLSSELMLAVAEAGFVHHPGGAPWHLGPDRPRMVSACLIVRDEEQQLRRCLASAADIADEVIIYDTGSTDGTVALARELGATVIEGYWDDDFGRARNAALEHCRGQWILWLDADEELRYEDAERLRSALERAPAGLDAFLLHIDNQKQHDAGTVLTHAASRLFRRAACHWEGRLHEQVMPRERSGQATVALLSEGRISHSGYLDRAMRSRNKGERNLRSAVADLAGGSQLDLGTRVLSLARSHLLSGGSEQGLELARRAVALSDDLQTRRFALRTLTETAASLGLIDEARATLAEYRRITDAIQFTRIIEGQLALYEGDYTAALTALNDVVDGIDELGFEYRTADVAPWRAAAYAGLGRYSDAADALLASLHQRGGLDTHLGRLIEALDGAGRNFAEILHALPSERRIAFVPQLLQLEGNAADRVLEDWYAYDPADTSILATAAQLARRLPTERQLLWSSRLRSTGLASACPLVRSAAQLADSPQSRALSAAVAWTSFSDPRALTALIAAVLELDDAVRASLSDQLNELNPALGALFHALPPKQASTPPSSRFDGARVLVVAAEATLSATFLAAQFSTQGHATTLLHPQPAGMGRALLAGTLVNVRGVTGYENDSDGRRSARAAAIRTYAEAPIDTLVLVGSLTTDVDEYASHFPLSKIVTIDSPEPVPGPLELGGSTPLNLRSGIVVTGDLQSWYRHEQGLLRAVFGALRDSEIAAPVFVIGNNIDTITGQLPAAVVTGADGDPRPLLSAARCAIIVGACDAEAHQALAAACGTPALVIRDAASIPAAMSDLSLVLTNAEEWTRRTAAIPETTPAPDLPLPVDARRRPRWNFDPADLRRIVVRVSGNGQLQEDLRVLLARASSDSRARGSIELALAENSDVEAGDESTAMVEIHADPERVASSCDADLTIVARSHDYVGIPAEWVGPLRDVVDDVWFPSIEIRDAAIRSGLPSARVLATVPTVDHELYSPEGARRPLRTSKSTRLLFAGPLTRAQGCDVLLEGYLSTFTASDDVCLVVLATADSDEQLLAEMRRAEHAALAEIELIDGALEPADLAALYRSCSAFVHPARADGSGRFLLQAMSCGLAPVTTSAGVAAELCDSETAYLIGSQYAVANGMDWIPTAAGILWHEPSRADFSAALRSVVGDAPQRTQRGVHARTKILAATDRASLWPHLVARLESLVATKRDSTGATQPLELV